MSVWQMFAVDIRKITKCVENQSEMSLNVSAAHRWCTWGHTVKPLPHRIPKWYTQIPQCLTASPLNHCSVISCYSNRATNSTVPCLFVVMLSLSLLTFHVLTCLIVVSTSLISPCNLSQDTMTKMSIIMSEQLWTAAQSETADRAHVDNYRSSQVYTVQKHLHWKILLLWDLISQVCLL